MLTVLAFHVICNRQERLEWTIILLVGSTFLFSARTILPLCVVDVAREFGWDKAETVMDLLIKKCNLILDLQDLSGR